MKRFILSVLTVGLVCVGVSASDFAPAVPELDLPADFETAEMVQKQAVVPEPAAAVTPSVKKQTAAAKKTTGTKKQTRKQQAVVTANASQANTDLVEPKKVSQPVQPSGPVVQQMVQAPTVSEQTVDQKTTVVANPLDNKAAQAVGSFVAARETSNPAATAKQAAKVVYNPVSDRDPTLSQDDTLLLKHREEERLRAIEAERQRKIEAERKRLAELERQRQLELERLRDPSREVRGKIRINGIIGQEVFIGNRVYTVGKSVLGARIVSVQPDAVVFVYKGQRFTKKVQLQ